MSEQKQDAATAVKESEPEQDAAEGKQKSSDPRDQETVPYPRLAEEVAKRKEIESRLNEVKGTLQKFQDVDPDEYRELKKAREEAEANKLKTEGKWEEMKDRLTTQHEKELEAERREREKRDQVIEQLTVENELNAAIEVAGILPEHRKAVRALLRMEAQPSVEWEDDTPKGVMGDVPISDYVESWAKTDEAAPYLPSSGASGSGARGSGGGTGRKPYGEMSEEEKMDFIDQHGQEEFLKHMMATK